MIGRRVRGGDRARDDGVIAAERGTGGDGSRSGSASPNPPRISFLAICAGYDPVFERALVGECERTSFFHRRPLSIPTDDVSTVRDTPPNLALAVPCAQHIEPLARDV